MIVGAPFELAFDESRLPKAHYRYGLKWCDENGSKKCFFCLPLGS